MKKPLELDHSDRGMGVVELNGDLLRELVPVVVAPAEPADDILEGAGHEEILLDETQFLPALRAIVRIEHFGDGLTGVLVAHRFLVTAAVESLEIEILSRLGGPEPEKIHGRRPVSWNRNVVRNTHQFPGSRPSGDIVADGVEDILYLTVDLDLGGVLGTHDLPGRAVLHPVVGKLDLVAVAELLLEKAVLVVDSVSDCRQIESGEGIEEAGCQSPETAVSKPHVVFLFA